MNGEQSQTTGWRRWATTAIALTLAAMNAYMGHAWLSAACGFGAGFLMCGTAFVEPLLEACNAR